MKFLRNEKGIALVMVLVIAMIGLAVVAALLFLVIQGTSMSGYHRFYRTADEAAVGGSDIAAVFIKNRGTPVAGLLNTQLLTQASNCLQDKLLRPRGANFLAAGNWGNCTGGGVDITMDPTAWPDMQFETPSLTGMPAYRVFVKIVDTVEGNSANTGLVTVGELYGAGVTNANSGEVSPPHVPYLYRVEVQAQDANNPRERARYSGLYVY